MGTGDSSLTKADMMQRMITDDTDTLLDYAQQKERRIFGVLLQATVYH